MADICTGRRTAAVRGEGIGGRWMAAFRMANWQSACMRCRSRAKSQAAGQLMISLAMSILRASASGGPRTIDPFLTSRLERVAVDWWKAAPSARCIRVWWRYYAYCSDKAILFRWRRDNWNKNCDDGTPSDGGLDRGGRPPRGEGRGTSIPRLEIGKPLKYEEEPLPDHDRGTTWMEMYIRSSSAVPTHTEAN